MHLIKKILVPHFLHFLLSVMLGGAFIWHSCLPFLPRWPTPGRWSNSIFAKSFPPRPDTTKPCISKFENITSGTRTTKQSILYFKISLLQLGQKQNKDTNKRWTPKSHKRKTMQITSWNYPPAFPLGKCSTAWRRWATRFVIFTFITFKCHYQLISGDILWVIHDRGTAAWLPRVCVDLVQNQRWMGWVQQVKAIVHNLVQDLCLNFKTKEEWGGSSSVQELAQE